MSFRVYVTKYALTQGIFEAQATDVRGGIIKLEGSWIDLFRKPDWHLSLEDARARAEEMRTAKIASLKKQLARLEVKQIKVRKIGEGT